jgi:selenocysteine-specific elongation factor
LELERSELKNASQVKFHTGTSEAAATVYLFQFDRLKPGGRCLVQVRLNEPVVAGPRDPFILRSLSPTRTIGGGVIVEALERRLKRTHPEVLTDIAARAEAVGDPKRFVEYCVRSAGKLAVTDRQISLRSKVPLAELAPLLDEMVSQSRVLALHPKLFMHVETAQQIAQALLDGVGAFHGQHPESPGITREQLLTDAGIRKDVFDATVARFLTGGVLVERKGLLALPQHRERVDDEEQELLDAVDAAFRSRLFDPPDLESLPRELRVSPKRIERAVRILLEQQRLVRVDQKLLFHEQAVAAARDRLVAYIREHGGLESVKFKYLLDTTRKYAIPLLAYFDKIGLTRRAGYTRLLR